MSILTAKEVSDKLRVSKVWPYRAAKLGIIPCYRMGFLIRFESQDIEEYLKKTKVEVGNGN